VIETRGFFPTGGSDLSENEDEDLLLIFYGGTLTIPFCYIDDNSLLDFTLSYFTTD
jgi:hypothetical protein